MLIYPTILYNPIIPKVGIMKHNHYWSSIADTIGLSSAENKAFWAEKRAFLVPPFTKKNLSF